MLPRVWRMTWAIGTVLVLETVLFALSAAPAVLLWIGFRSLAASGSPWAVPVAFLAFGPGYLLFTILLMVLSALATRALGWRTPPDAEMSIAALSWPLLRWVRYVAVSHVVGVFAGGLLRATPLWTFYLRLNGARVGRRVYVNTLGLTDHNLLELGEGVVLGSDVHLSGHTVERGVVRTGRVRLGRNVTVGVGSVVGIDVEIGAGTQVGALSLVPKHSRLSGGATYVGVPVHAVDGVGAAA